MKKIFLLLATVTMLFASCDKIEEGNYTVFAGQAGEWYDGNGVANQVQRAFLEKYTGVKCVNCPAADEVINAALSKYEGSLVAVAVHDTSSFTIPFPNNPDLRTDDGDTWSKTFGVSAYPRAMVNRSSENGTFNLFDPGAGVDNQIEACLAHPCRVAIDANSRLSSENMATVQVDIEFLQTIANPLTLTLLVMEDGIMCKQSTPQGTDPAYEQNHVLRDVVTDVFGAEVDANGLAGTKRFVTFQVKLDETWNFEKCHFVAFISNKESKEILNVAECHVL